MLKAEYNQDAHNMSIEVVRSLNDKHLTYLIL